MHTSLNSSCSSPVLFGVRANTVSHAPKISNPFDKEVENQIINRLADQFENQSGKYPAIAAHLEQYPRLQEKVIKEVGRREEKEKQGAPPSNNKGRTDSTERSH